METCGMIIARTGLSAEALSGQVAIVTGAGGGIGYEAARALAWLGAQVIIAEIDAAKGAGAATKLAGEFGEGRVYFIQTDVGDEYSVENLAGESLGWFGKVDIVINNATIANLGLVKDLPIGVWDASYRVNLRGPVLMARTFLPGMCERDHGVFVNVSSTGTAYMGAYETFKAAQVHLANTLDAELEDTGVIAFTIGPGLVPTQTARNAIAELAPQMGLTVDGFFKQNESALLSVEEAGAGFAAAVVLAEKFRGQEISSMQALKATHFDFGSGETAAGLPSELPAGSPEIPAESFDAGLGGYEQARSLCERIRVTLKEQSDDWKRRSLFERQWVIRDFKKTAGMPVEAWLDALEQLEVSLLGGGSIQRPPLDRLANYYNHLAELAKGYEKNPGKLEENLRHVYAWRDEVEALIRIIGS